MASKALVFLGLFVVMVLLISSEVAARELAEETKETKATEVDQYGGGYGGGRGGYGGWRGGYGGGRGGYGGGYGGWRGGYGGGRGGYGGGYGGWRGGYGGGRGGYGGGWRCRYGCRYSGQAVDPNSVEDETHN